mmetsp:Transcript_72730/g.236184  ORF Transcript_72730/g.236184 Transcript_72730/m.236184 type:complete len:263 (+) Transcript_72730:431-1219(+)
MLNKNGALQPPLVHMCASHDKSAAGGTLHGSTHHLGHSPSGSSHAGLHLEDQGATSLQQRLCVLSPVRHAMCEIMCQASCDTFIHLKTSLARDQRFRMLGVAAEAARGAVIRRLLLLGAVGWVADHDVVPLFGQLPPHLRVAQPREVREYSTHARSPRLAEDVTSIGQASPHRRFVNVDTVPRASITELAEHRQEQGTGADTEVKDPRGRRPTIYAPQHLHSCVHERSGGRPRPQLLLGHEQRHAPELHNAAASRSRALLGQ